VVQISRGIADRLVLHEGADMRVFAGPEALTRIRLTPYDAFALYLHYSRARLTKSP
jgi:hypothetical protein